MKEFILERLVEDARENQSVTVLSVDWAFAGVEDEKELSRQNHFSLTIAFNIKKYLEDGAYFTHIICDFTTYSYLYWIDFIQTFISRDKHQKDTDYKIMVGGEEVVFSSFPMLRSKADRKFVLFSDLKNYNKLIFIDDIRGMYGGELNEKESNAYLW